MGAKAVKTSNAQLVDAVIVPITGQDDIGNGDGLPTEAHQTAAELTPGDWAARQFVPYAVIPPAKQTPVVHIWQLVFGIEVLHPGQRASLQQVIVTFGQGHHTYHLESQLHDVVQAKGVGFTDSTTSC
jgi:hypothetical protein